MMTKELKISSKKQITVPQKVLDRLGIGPGDSIHFNIDDKHIEVCADKKKRISALDLGKRFAGFPKKKLTLKQIKNAIEEGYSGMAAKTR